MLISNPVICVGDTYLSFNETNKSLLQEQSQLLWKIRDALQKDVNNTAMKLLLELNGQGIPSGESKVNM